MTKYVIARNLREAMRTTASGEATLHHTLEEAKAAARRTSGLHAFKVEVTIECHGAETTR